jgi:Arc/MetJ-type ribon-helix-helix transcriptional regulator
MLNEIIFMISNGSYKNRNFKYQLILLGIMATQINVRLPDSLLSSARSYAEERGYGNLQDFIKETIREKLFEEPTISKEELQLVKKLAKVSEKNNLFGTEKELFAKLRKK